MSCVTSAAHKLCVCVAGRCLIAEYAKPMSNTHKGVPWHADVSLSLPPAAGKCNILYKWLHVWWLSSTEVTHSLEKDIDHLQEPSRTVVSSIEQHPNRP